jgi:hypothetical protein
MRLGKCVLLKEADGLLGYTDGILRDLKNAEMAIREINSTWHDTARGVGLPPGTSRAPTESHPPDALATLLGSSCGTPVTCSIGSSSDVSEGGRAGRDRDRRRHSVSWYRARNVVRMCCGRYRSVTRLVYALTIILIRRFVYLSG